MFMKVEGEDLSAQEIQDSQVEKNRHVISQNSPGDICADCVRCWNTA